MVMSLGLDVDDGHHTIMQSCTNASWRIVLEFPVYRRICPGKISTIKNHLDRDLTELESKTRRGLHRCPGLSWPMS
ncbi:hypothetical protein TNCV_4962481 [Trichonephila clavipes]|nr:hypothetical protein TNCV_4962481 [Trichonephila clavipes]